MNCETCKVGMKCLSTRDGANGRRRRYICFTCKSRITTLEQQAALESGTHAVSTLSSVSRRQILQSIALMKVALADIRAALDK